MDFTIPQREFLRGLARTQGVADRKNSVPILSNILLSSEGTSRIRFAASDLYLGVTAVSPAAVHKAGSVAVSAKTLFEIVRQLPDVDVRLHVAQNHSVTIEAQKIKYKIPGLPGEDFPPLPHPADSDWASMSAWKLGELVALTSYSMSTDDTRPYLAGTLFECQGETVRMVTTDGHRLSKAEAREEGLTTNFSMLVPHKGIIELKKVIEDSKSKDKTDSSIEVAASAGYAFFKRHEVLLSVRLTEEKFPQYSKAIPQQQKKRVVALRSKLVDSLRRISLVANDKSGAVQLQLQNGLLRILSQNPDVGEGIEEIDVDYEGDRLDVKFNAKYLLEALSAVSHDEVALGLDGELDACVVRPVGEGPTDFIGLVMPMRI